MAKVFIMIGVVSCIFNNLLRGDKEIFEISSYDDSHDDESANELIKATNFFNSRILKRDENKYKPLHSYVKQYNQRIAEAKIQIPNEFHHVQLDKRDIFNPLPEVKLHITRRKDKLNKYLEVSMKESINTTRKKRNVSRQNVPNYDNVFENYMNFAEVTGYMDNIKLNSYQEEDPSPLLSINIEDINNYIQLSTTISIESILESTEENIYDYNAVKMYYEQKIEKDKYINDTLDYKKEQITEEPREQIINFNNTINCTNKDLSYFNINAIKCVFHNYLYMKDKTEARQILLNTWLIIKISLFIYICIAIPCWCQTGWCCCCFRCKICFPRKRIMFAKQYFIRNPPGILMAKLSKKRSVKYIPSELEEDIYEQFETAIRNI